MDLIKQLCVFCRKAEGYPSGNFTLENKLLASKYIEADNHWQLLANCTEVKICIFTVILNYVIWQHCTQTIVNQYCVIVAIETFSILIVCIKGFIYIYYEIRTLGTTTTKKQTRN